MFSDLCTKITMLNKSDYLILFSAFISFLFSVILWFAGLTEAGQYVSIWVPSILILGVYLRTLKTQK